MAISDILTGFGFETRSDKTQWWGIGSLVWGYTAEVRNLGNDLYEVKYHAWKYDCDGELCKNEDTKSTLHGALLLQFLFEKLPLFRR